jgi:hypothetical protein
VLIKLNKNGKINTDRNIAMRRALSPDAVKVMMALQFVLVAAMTMAMAIGRLEFSEPGMIRIIS